jgi:hypothetical protein
MAEMVSNPCSATLVPGLYGSDAGMLARLKRSLRLNYTNDPGATAGYVAWCPDYTKLGNLVIHRTTDSSVGPTNTALDPFGTAASKASFIGDPAQGFLNSDIVSDMRPIGACVTMQYIGSLRDSSGEVAFIHNIPAADLLTGGVGGSPLTVDDIFAYSTEKRRFGLETLENIFKPTDENSVHFRTQDDALYTNAPTILSQNADNFSPTMIGFAWRGTNPEAPITFDYIKNVEWRAETSAGLGQTSNASVGTSALPIVRRTIEEQHPQPWLRVAGNGLMQQGRVAFQQAGTQVVEHGKHKFLEFIKKEMGSLLQGGLSSAIPLMLSL